MSIMNAKEVLIVVVLLYGLPVLAEDFTLQSAINYLKHYGHIKPGDDRRKSTNTYLRDFQAYTGLPQSGILDKATVDLMKSPRCGVKDDVVNKRSLFYGKWEKKEVSYRIVNYSRKMSTNYVDKICRKAMYLWEGVADIKFIHKTSGKADIEISFGTRDHGDILPGCHGPFDGPSSPDGPRTELAHAFYPKLRRCTKKELAGDVHIDDDEDWSETFDNGKDLLYVVTHELGHSLGLAHSKGVKEAIMHPHYPGWIKGLKLHSHDVKRIQKIYGKPPTTSPTPRPPSPPTPDPGNCICDSFTRFDPKRNRDVEKIQECEK